MYTLKRSILDTNGEKYGPSLLGMYILVVLNKIEEASGSDNEKLHGETQRQKCCFYSRIKL